MYYFRDDDLFLVTTELGNELECMVSWAYDEDDEGFGEFDYFDITKVNDKGYLLLDKLGDYEFEKYFGISETELTDKIKLQIYEDMSIMGE